MVIEVIFASPTATGDSIEPAFTVAYISPVANSPLFTILVFPVIVVVPAPLTGSCNPLALNEAVIVPAVPVLTYPALTVGVTDLVPVLAGAVTYPLLLLTVSVVVPV